MASFNEMLKYISFRYYNKFNKICKPLSDHFSVSHFSYIKITNSGLFSCLTNRPEWMEYYFGEKFHLLQPHFSHPDNHRTGICFPKLIQNQGYQQAMQIAKNKFQIHPSIIITQTYNDSVDFFSFDLKCSDPFLDTLLINELSLLRKFTQKFRQENNSIFSLLDSYQVELTDLIGTNFHFNNASLVASLPDRNLFIKEMGLGLKPGLNLSKRDVEVLHYLLQGASANLIADELFLSKRTIEHYIEKLKNKLTCHSKMDLICKARELESLGYL